MENLYLIVGLGNPGKEYAGTRHNAGFLVLEQLGQRWRANWNLEKKFSSRLAKMERNGRKIILAQPQTFMNASGKAVASLSSFFRLPTAQVLIVVDDADLPFGEIRMRSGGSSGGHHGLESIEQHLGTREFPRLRIGIGRRATDNREITNYVLGQFAADERELMGKILTRAGEQIDCWLNAGIQKAMSQFNGAVIAPNKGKTE
jgi:PTH1 family peptidyl-tRNA hydrolase